MKKHLPCHHRLDERGKWEPFLSRVNIFQGNEVLRLMHITDTKLDQQRLKIENCNLALVV